MKREGPKWGTLDSPGKWPQYLLDKEDLSNKSEKLIPSSLIKGPATLDVSTY